MFRRLVPSWLNGDSEGRSSPPVPRGPDRRRKNKGKLKRKDNRLLVKEEQEFSSATQSDNSNGEVPGQ